MDKLFEITEGIYAEVTEWRGAKRVDIRKWYETKTGELARTQKGINMSLEEWANFCIKFEEIKKYVETELAKE